MAHNTYNNEKLEAMKENIVKMNGGSKGRLKLIVDMESKMMYLVCEMTREKSSQSIQHEKDSSHYYE